MNEWCRIVMVDGKQVLFQKMLDCEDENYKIEVTVNASDWIKKSPFANVIIYVDMEGRELTVENFNFFASKKNARKLIYEKIIPHMKAKARSMGAGPDSNQKTEKKPFIKRLFG